MYKTPTDLINASITSTNYQKEFQRNTLALPQSIRWFIYFLFLISNILISFDHESISASIKKLHKLIKVIKQLDYLVH